MYFLTSYRTYRPIHEAIYLEVRLGTARLGPARLTPILSLELLVELDLFEAINWASNIAKTCPQVLCLNCVDTESGLEGLDRCGYVTACRTDGLDGVDYVLGCRFLLAEVITKLLKLHKL